MDYIEDFKDVMKYHEVIGLCMVEVKLMAVKIVIGTARWSTLRRCCKSRKALGSGLGFNMARLLTTRKVDRDVMTEQAQCWIRRWIR